MGHLTENQSDLFGQLEEECAEVIQAVRKADRFGLSSVYQGRSNLQNIQQEVADVVAVVYALSIAFPEIFENKEMEAAVSRKLVKLKKYYPQLRELITDLGE